MDSDKTTVVALNVPNVTADVSATSAAMSSDIGTPLAASTEECMADCSADCEQIMESGVSDNSIEADLGAPGDRETQRLSLAPAIGQNVDTPVILSALSDTAIDDNGVVSFESRVEADVNCDSTNSTPNRINKIQQVKHFATTTPLGAIRESSISLKRELELAMSLETGRCNQRVLHKTFPKSVVNEDRSRTDDEEQIQILSNYYELFQSGVLENLFSHGEPVFEMKVDPSVTTVDSKVEKEVTTAEWDENPNTREKLKSREQQSLIDCLLLEKNEICKRYESLKGHLFQKEQQLKVACDEIKQLTKSY